MIRRLIFIIFFISFALKICMALYFNAADRLEVFEYEKIADNILKGSGFVHRFYGTPHKALVQPFYPVLTAIAYSLTNHSRHAMILLQCFISSLLIFVVYSIAVQFTDAKAAFLAAVLTALHPGINVYSIFKLHPLVFDAFFYLLTVAAILKFIQWPNSKRALLTGAVSGLAMLSRITILPFVFFTLIYIFILRSINIKARLKYFFIICLSAALVYAPWVIRNYRVFGRFVFMATTSGENLWCGNNQLASGSAILSYGDSVHTTMPKQMSEDLNKLDELSQNRYYHNYFLNFVKKQPVLFFRLFLKKLYYFWWFSPQTGALYSKLWLYIYKIYYGLVLVFACLGIMLTLRARKYSQVMVIIFAYMSSISFIHALVNIDTRHRWVVEPLVLIFTAVGLLYLLKGIRKCLVMKI